MIRVQSIVTRNRRILMAKHRLHGREWWCLPGGGLEAGETPEAGALRELREECNVEGMIVRKTAHIQSDAYGDTITYLVEIGEQTPTLGHDPEFAEDNQPLIDVRWLNLAEIPERDRAFLWAAGLLGVADFWVEVESWGDDLSYPQNHRKNLDHER